VSRNLKGSKPRRTAVGAATSAHAGTMLARRNVFVGFRDGRLAFTMAGVTSGRETSLGGANPTPQFAVLHSPNDTRSSRCNHCLMSAVRVRPMTNIEFDKWQTTIAEEFAAEQVAAGRWPVKGSVRRALESNSELLPLGLSTPRMLILRGVSSDGEPVGRAWVGLDHPRGALDMAFLYDIEVIEHRRGYGLGRALLTAVEDAVMNAGVYSLELNVFGRNLPAVALYDSAGYAVSTQQMQKHLRR
jgi:ribosomal protein S18 acetylase RimI-like enzyme